MKRKSTASKSQHNGFVSVKGARENNLKNVSLEIPRDAMVVFTGVSGSGKSSLAFGTLYAEAQRRYLESVSPYARRLFNQMSVPEVDEIEGLPPAIALQQQRGSGSSRSSVGSITTLSNLLRMLYSRAGQYPEGQNILYAEAFSYNTPEGACTECHGLGRVYQVSERSMVPDDTLSIRQRAIAAWPTAWQGQNLRDILITLGYDVDTPWKDLSQKDRDWILFTEEKPVVPVYPGLNGVQVQDAIKKDIPPSYMGTFTGARRYVLQTFAGSQSQLMRNRVSKFMLSAECPVCHGKKLKKESLSILFDEMDITELSAQPINSLYKIFTPYANGTAKKKAGDHRHPEKHIVTKRIAEDIIARLAVMLDLGLGYLGLDRSTPTLSPGELQRLRLATQIRSNLFGVVYVLDEPSAGLHPADTAALLRALDKLKASGNSLFVVEHEIDVIRHAEWIVDVGPGAGENGGQIIYSGPAAGLKNAEGSKTREYLYGQKIKKKKDNREPAGWLELEKVTHHNLQGLNVSFPIGVFTSVTGISGSGKSSLVSQVLVSLVAAQLGLKQLGSDDTQINLLEKEISVAPKGKIAKGMDAIKRLVVVDQKPIGRTPRSNLATYTGLFDPIRKLFATLPESRRRKYDAGHFSFNIAKGRCGHCQGEGFVMVELLFLPSVYTPCPVCLGTRYNAKTLEINYRDKNIAEVLAMSVDSAWAFFKDEPQIHRGLDIVRQVGLGYIKLGQSATELSGGEAQRIKLAAELQRTQHGNSLYVLDEPTTGLHPADVERLMLQLGRLVDQGNTVIVVEHDMQVIADSDWVIEIGPGAGDLGGKVTASGTPEVFAKISESKTAPYLSKFLQSGQF
ncbi:excinuclease ABC subunit A [Pedobacter antarcticus 4BY]|uniref:UvrABC system protein A n=2 Tax=Pedobacter antarcticus TaxID=34086 RepID=A0A081PCH3_9SPHI|nr:excinuclease ABC subunit UvrA [Pedobacter antarcticus]KEQ28396.1 excinuclease ABC subunit A [Pedobacter antarcticus 4BY]SFF05014.1 excinuclease ABC subunit A [Pedobacter antarcticus]